jgi:hypothetical protein
MSVRFSIRQSGGSGGEKMLNTKEATAIDGEKAVEDY